MATRLRKYAAVNAKLRTKMSRFLDTADFARLIKSESIESALSFLAAFGYKNLTAAYESGRKIQACEYEMITAEIADLSEIRKFVSGEVLNFVDALTIRNEIQTLKMVLRLWFENTVTKTVSSRDERFIFKGYSKVPVDLIIEAPDIDSVVRALAGTPYQRILNDNKAYFAADSTLFRIEIALDNHFYHQLAEAAAHLSKGDRDIARKLLGVEIDMENLDRILRFRDLIGLSAAESSSLLIPVEDGANAAKMRGLFASGDSAEIVEKYITGRYRGLTPLLGTKSANKYTKHLILERIMDEVVSLEIRRVLTAYPFTLGIILSYFILKRRETRRIKLVLNGIFYGLDEDRIQNLL
ncbi:MAG: V-type ATPase subunit [Spirochaetales bacterium]|jgi:V/A-type H+/Na+-transporting ATPase subunit C|nr:V-type ATPase subunit [Spirochaetales bacterium]